MRVFVTSGHARTLLTEWLRRYDLVPAIARPEVVELDAEVRRVGEWQAMEASHAILSVAGVAPSGYVELGRGLELGLPAILVAPDRILQARGVLVVPSIQDAIVTLCSWRALLVDPICSDAEGLHPGRERVVAARALIIDTLREAAGERDPDTLRERGRWLASQAEAHRQAWSQLTESRAN